MNTARKFISQLNGRNYRRFRPLVIWFFLFCTLQTGCSTYVHDELIRRGQLTESVISSSHFRHRVFEKSTKGHQGNTLHVYIEGDGRPWRRRNLIAADPTPTRPLLLRAFLQDDSNSVYLGRPCYYQVRDPACSPLWWTHHRYHKSVVASMVEIIESLAQGKEDLWLIGHSGGGTLAVLVGRRLNRPVRVVTAGGNLDLHAWTDHHRYSPLTGSLNPGEDHARNPQMEELHWYGLKDRTILPKWTLTYCKRAQATCIPIDTDHRQGWLTRWRDILNKSQAIFAGAARKTIGNTGTGHAAGRKPAETPYNHSDGSRR